MRSLVPLALSALLPACGGPVGARQQERIPDPDAPSVRPAEQPAPWPAGAPVVFYNVENLFDTRNDPGPGDDDLTPDGSLKWTQERYARKLQHLAEAVALAGEDLPVLVGLCEVENARVVEDLAGTSPLGNERYTVVHHDSPDERGIDVALLYQERLFDLLAEDMFAGIPVAMETKDKLKGLEVFEAPAGKALVIDHVGPYSSTMTSHEAMDAHMKANNLSLNQVVIEEYVTDPGAEPDSMKWHTNVIYLVK